ncbi:expressed unknown protein [Seminavis robusta]|uniref:Uncharacterized protein n=1 Tax=Seminavis robusta TaxID=568900 RepID=A0A9N8EKS2_9STRA|nr:expressed unknown protein [Seminavis robusta]|eukprot:Sro1245_g255710.1 n/a (134) ;mRNA; f:20248-20734
MPQRFLPARLFGMGGLQVSTRLTPPDSSISWEDDKPCHIYDHTKDQLLGLSHANASDALQLPLKLLRQLNKSDMFLGTPGSRPALDLLAQMTRTTAHHSGAPVPKLARKPRRHNMFNICISSNIGPLETVTSI